MALRLVLPALLILLWWTGSQNEGYGLYIPSPAAAVDRVFADYVMGDGVTSTVLPSVTRALAGFLLAVVVGVGLGVAIGLQPVLAALCAPVVHFGRSLPTPALLGAFFILFGTGDFPKILLIAFSVVWPILFNTIDGVASIGATRAHVVQVFKIPAGAVLRRVVLPGIAPKAFAGARISLSLSLILMIISELQKASNGLGYQLVYAQRSFDFEGFWSVLIVLALLGVTFNVVFGRLERRVLSWHRGATVQDA
jgi:ABC-type nitrate/sulfonate/bicarbonate transport system permease component